MRDHIIGVPDLAHDEPLAGFHTDHRVKLITVEAEAEHLGVEVGVEVHAVLIAEQDALGRFRGVARAYDGLGERDGWDGLPRLAAHALHRLREVGHGDMVPVEAVHLDGAADLIIRGGEEHAVLIEGAFDLGEADRRHVRRGDDVPGPRAHQPDVHRVLADVIAAAEAVADRHE